MSTWGPGGNQDHSGHLRRTGDGFRADLQAPATSRVLGNCKDLWAPGPVICFPSILVSMPSSQFYLLKCLLKGLQRAHCPLPTGHLAHTNVYSTRFPQHPWPSLPADELTVFIGRGTLRDWGLHQGTPARLFSSPSSTCSLPWNHQAG